MTQQPIPTAGEIAPATMQPDHPDKTVARLYDDWRLLAEGFRKALIECQLIDDDSAAQPLGRRADEALCALARHPVETVAGLALKLEAARIDEGRLGVTIHDMDPHAQAVEGARLDALRLAKEGAGQ